MSKWAVGRDGLPKGDGLPTVLGKRDGQPREAGASLSNYGVDSSRPRRDTRCVALHAVSNWDNVFDQTAEGGTDHIKMWRISTADYSQRPAKKQAVHDDAGKALQRAEGCNEFNIWYGKWIGEQWCDKGMTAAPSRCSVRRDAGRTKADDRLGMAAYCCVFFARGCCSNGSDCTFLHRIPSEDDEKRLALTHDIFGRERHNTNRDDMRGVGNFNSESRTLYIGGLKILHGATATFQTLLRQMSEWGEVEQLRLIPNKAIAFVRYKLRACAEFALESMHCQSLGLDELLNVRWAYDDPNPKVRAMIQENYHAQLVEACAAKGHHVSSVDFHLPTDYAIDQDPEAKRARREGGEGGNRVCAEYPNTDGQFCYSWSSSAETADSAAGATAGMRERVSGDFAPMSRAEVEALEEADRVREEREREQAKAREAERRLAAILDGVGKGVQEAGGKEGGGRSAEEQHDWREAFDQSTGRPYYYCAHTGVTTWERPTAATSDSTAATSDSTAASSDIARGIASCTSDGVAGSGSDTERRAHEWNRQVEDYARSWGVPVERADEWLRRQWWESGSHELGAESNDGPGERGREGSWSGEGGWGGDPTRKGDVAHILKAETVPGGGGTEDEDLQALLEAAHDHDTTAREARGAGQERQER